MRIRLLLCALFFVLAFGAMGQKKIALLEPRVGEGSTGVTGMEKAMVRGEMRKAIVNHTGYEAFTRADIDKLMSEQDFQRTGMVSDDQIKKIGVMSGADFICVSTLNKSNTEFYLEAYLVNVESAQISNPASQYGELIGGKLGNMLPVCQALAQELLGTISPVVSQMGVDQQPVSNTGNGSAAKKTSASRNNDVAASASSQQAPQMVSQQYSSSATAMSLNDMIGTVKTFADGTKGVVFYAEGGIGLAVSLDAAEMRWHTADKKKDAVDISQIANNEDDDQNFVAGIGVNYTTAIVAEINYGGAPAAEWCVKHGSGWYLPSAGELVYLFRVRNDVKGNELLEAALRRAGGSWLENGWYWSSSECSRMEAINVSSGGRASCEEKKEPQKVRAVRKFAY